MTPLVLNSVHSKWKI